MDKSCITFKYYRLGRLAEKQKKLLVNTLAIIFVFILIALVLFSSKDGLSYLTSGDAIQFFILFICLSLLSLKISGRVHVDDEGMSIEYKLPFGLSRFFKYKKIIKWQEILEIQISEQIGHFTVESEEDCFKALQPVKWIFILKNSQRLSIFPFLCVEAEQISSYANLKIDNTQKIQLCSRENLERLHCLYMNWPFIAEVSKHNVVVPSLTFNESYLATDILPTKRMKLGFLLALLLTFIVFMLIPLTQGNHIQSTDTFMMPICAGIFLALLSIYWMKNDPIKPKWMPVISISIFVGFVIALTWWPLLTMVNNMGGEQSYEQRYVIKQGILVAHHTGHEPSSCNQDIELPDLKSRLAFLREGTEVKLMTKKGLLGFCQYNGEGLRLAADAQKIK